VRGGDVQVQLLRDLTPCGFPLGHHFGDGDVAVQPEERRRMPVKNTIALTTATLRVDVGLDGAHACMARIEPGTDNGRHSGLSSAALKVPRCQAFYWLRSEVSRTPCRWGSRLRGRVGAGAW